jgi:hypothetical protein
VDNSYKQPLQTMTDLCEMRMQNGARPFCVMLAEMVSGVCYHCVFRSHMPTVNILVILEGNAGYSRRGG